MVDWQNYVTESQNSLRVLAELTGGYAAVNQNDFTRRSSASTTRRATTTSSATTRATRIRRRSAAGIDVKVTRPDLNVLHRTEYTLKAPPVQKPAPAKMIKGTPKGPPKDVAFDRRDVTGRA